jgi:hypothetical protein
MAPIIHRPNGYFQNNISIEELMKKNKVIRILAMIFFCMLIFWLIIMGTPPYSPPDRNCPIITTIISLDSFPPETIGNDYFTPEKPQWEAIGRTFVSDYTNTVNLSFRYRNKRLAKEKFDVSLNAYLRDENWYIPTKISFQSQIANNFVIYCNDNWNPSAGIRCEAEGLYEEYIIGLYTYINEDDISFELYENLLIELDYRMKKCFGISNTE